MYAYQKTHRVSEGCPLKKHGVPFTVTVVELVGVHRPHSGAGPGVGGPNRVLNFYCALFKNAKSNAELKGLDVDSLVTGHIQVNKAPKVWCRT